MKKKKNTPNTPALPTATNVDFPVFVPNENGSTDIEVGRARLRYGTLVVEFKDSAPAVAIQNMIQRGVLLGFGMIMLKPDVVNNMYQEVVAHEEAVAKATEQAVAAGILRRNDEGKVESVNPDQTVEEVLEVFLHLDQITADPPTESNTLKNLNQDEENN